MLRSFLFLGFFVFTYPSIAQTMDTVTRSRISFGGDTSLAINRIINQSNGNQIVLATAQLVNSVLIFPVIFLVDKQGAILWSISFSNSGDSTLHFYDALQLNNGTIKLYGLSSYNVVSSKLFRHCLIDLSSNGSVLSYTAFEINSPFAFVDIYKAHLCEFDNGQFGLLVDFTVNSVSSYFYIGKFSNSNVNIWSNSFFSPVTDFHPFDFIKSSSVLILPGNFYFSLTSCSPVGKGSTILKLDEQTGNLLGNKSYCFSSSDFSIGELNSAPVTLSANRTINTLSLNADSGVYNFICVKYDTSLNVISSKVIKKNSSFDFFPVSHNFNKNGTFIYSVVDPNNVADNFYAVMDSNYNFLQERKVHFDSLPVGNEVASITNSGKAFLLCEVKIGNKNALDCIETGAYNCDVSCIGSPASIFQINDFPLQPSNDNYLRDTMCSVSSIPFLLYPKKLFLQKNIFCQSISNLKDSIKIKGASRICRIDTAAIYVAQGVGKCSGVMWAIDTAAHSVITNINDTTVSIKFTKPWSGFLYAFSQKDSSIKDSIKLTILQVDTISFLPPDTSLCANDSIKISVGNSFSTYLWNTGDTTSTITVSQKGIYIVKAILYSGCFILDTFAIKQIYSIPLVVLDSSRWLCRGKNITLNAGTGYKKYLWQDGSVNQTYIVKNTGLFWVQVKDTNGCYGSDTSIISTIVDTPSHFIYTDTSICKYQALELIPLKTYLNYYWSTGASSPTLFITEAGIYNLSVADTNGCAGMESVNVKSKTCANSLIFPNAFSPNNDGKNDLFKPYKTGIFYHYELSIFNRWGQKVFSTNNPNSGWDGSYQSTPQNSSTFVWVCIYQFAAETLKTQKGTVVLIR